ncbi:MAG: hypothetical protein ACI8ZN_001827 [Bacteroidia bacterium]|jgi:hypothetical protein
MLQRVHQNYIQLAFFKLPKRNNTWRMITGKLALLMTSTTLLLFAFTNHAVAQDNLTLYNMKTVPQRIAINPALKSDAGSFVGFPLVSSQQFGFTNSTLSLGAVLSTIEQGNGDTTYLNLTKFAGLMKKTNFFGIDYSTDLLGIGFSIGKKNYLYLSSSLTFAARINYPGDLIALITEGNGGKNLDRTFNFDFGFDQIAYADFGLGYSRKLMDDKLTVGARYRYIKGISAFNTERNDLTFHTNPHGYDLTVSADLKFNASNSVGSMDSLNDMANFDPTELTMQDVLQSKNSGYALDFGMEYRLTSAITITASVRNIGKITWNTNVINAVSEHPGASYPFTGVDIDDLEPERPREIMGRIADTLIDRFRLKQTNTSFTTGLFASFYLGGNYNIMKDHNVGVLFSGGVYQSYINPAITLSWNSKLTNVLAISSSYTIANNSFANLGLGFSLNLGPIQLYAVSDNLVGVFFPNDVQNLSARVGINITGKRQDEEKAAAKKEAQQRKKAAKKNK